MHLGQDDLPVREARRILGPDALIGVSTHNLEQVRQAVLDGASYIGVGPTFVALCVRGPFLVTSVKVARPGAPSPPVPGALTSFDP